MHTPEAVGSVLLPRVCLQSSLGPAVQSAITCLSPRVPDPVVFFIEASDIGTP